MSLIDAENRRHDPPAEPVRLWRAPALVLVGAAVYAAIGMAVLSPGPWDVPPAYFVYAPSGIAFGFLVLLDRSALPIALLGAGTVTHLTGGSVTHVLATALGAAAEMEVARRLLLRRRFERRTFDLRALSTLVLVAFAAGAVGACFGTTGLALSTDRPAAALARVWWMWAAGHGLGILIVGSPFALAWSRPRDARHQRIVESLFATVALVLAAQLTFSTEMEALTGFPIEYLTYPFLIWAALRLTPFWVAICNLFLVTSALVWTGLGMGPLYRGEMATSLIWVGVFGLATWLSTLSLSAIVTERVETEAALRDAKRQAERADQAKSDFLANMSHEIRTPMNGVIGMTDLLLASPLQSEQVHYAETIRSSAESLLTVINDILDFSKIEAGALTIDPQPFDLRLAVADVMGMLEVRAREQNNELSVFYAGDCARHVVGDPARIRQVLVNLIGNALKFTHDGQVSLRVQAVDTGPGKARFRFEVKDTGIGIEPERIPTLFEKFTQADGSTKRRYSGTGLGLAICRNLVALMEGTIGARSRVGVGSVFWFELPLTIAALPAGAPRNVDLRHLRVLAIDDCLVNLRLVTEQLRGVVERVDVTTRGEEGIEMLQRAAARGAAYGMVLLDYQMPDLDGVDVAERLRKLPEVADTPLIMLTSFQRSGDRERLLRTGFSGYLVKPVLASDLIAVMGAVSQAPGSAPDRLITRETVAEVREPFRLEPLFGDDASVDVLVAEDNPVNQAVARSMLEKLGCRVTLATDGQQAVELATQRSFAVVFMDCQMPRLDGYEATAALRGAESGRAATPIVAMTAHVMSGDRERCLAAGMDDYIPKPIRPEELRRVLERWVAVPAGSD
ncbi:MAG: response regulator [Gemmatimonadota bacterium]